MDKQAIGAFVKILLGDSKIRAVLESLHTSLHSMQPLTSLAEQPTSTNPHLDPHLVLRIAYTFGRGRHYTPPDEDTATTLREAYRAVLGEEYRGNVIRFSVAYGLNRNTVLKYLRRLGIAEELGHSE